MRSRLHRAYPRRICFWRHTGDRRAKRVLILALTVSAAGACENLSSLKLDSATIGSAQVVAAFSLRKGIDPEAVSAWKAEVVLISLTVPLPLLGGHSIFFQKMEKLSAMESVYPRLGWNSCIFNDSAPGPVLLPTAWCFAWREEP